MPSPKYLPMFLAAATALMGLGLSENALAAEALPPRLLEQARPTITLPSYTPDERELVARQAYTLLNEVWVNKVYKWDNHLVHGPELMGKVLREARQMDDATFHGRMVDVFEKIVDLHTQYTLPKPYQCYASLLAPDFVAARDAQGNMRTMVTGLRKSISGLIAATPYGADLSKIVPGDIVLGYDGMEINAALRKLAKAGQGANAAAAETQAIALMDFRWHAQKLLPEKDTVELRLRHADGTEETVVTPWVVMSDGECLNPQPAEDGLAKKADPVDALSLSLNRSAYARQTFLARNGELTLEAPSLKVQDHPVEPKLHYGLIENENGTFGYLRIDDFMPTKIKGVDAYLRAVGDILIALRNTKGLIIDLRGNPGGNGNLAEGLVQLFTPRPVKDVSLRMLVSETNRKIMSLPLWKGSPSEQAHTAGLARHLTLTDNFPFLANADLNEIGQFYFQPVALLVDPSCYSSCDVFSAHMQDHRAATVWGLNGWQTGAGGGNIIQYEQFREWFQRSGVPEEQSPFVALPAGQSFSVGWRQIHRTGLHNNQAVEDAGVKADRVVFRSLEALRAGNRTAIFEPILKKLSVDYANRAGSAFHLASSGEVDLLTGTDLSLKGIMVNTDKVMAFLDGKPLRDLDVNVNGSQEFSLDIPFSDKPVKYYRIDLYGLRGNDTAWHVVRTVRIRPASVTLGSAGLKLDFESGIPSNLGIYTWSPVSTSGWQVSGGKLVSNTTPNYDVRAQSVATLFVNLEGRESATLDFEASINTEPDRGFFYVQATSAEGEAMLQEPVSGNLGDKRLTFDLTPFAGKQVEIHFVFVAQGGQGAPGVSLDNVSLR